MCTIFTFLRTPESPLALKKRTIILYITFLILLSPNLLNGQSLIGVYGGINSSKFHYSATNHFSADFDSKNTWLFGIHYKGRKDQLINLSLAVDYLYRAVFIDAHYGGLGGWTGRNMDVDIYSINLRVLPEIRLGKKFGVYINIGPYFGFIVNTRKTETGSSGTYDGNHISWEESGSAKDDFNGIDFGVSSTLGFEIPLTPNLFLLTDVSYGVGISNIADGSLGSYAGKINSTNFYITAGLVYKLRDFILFRNTHKK